MTDDESPGLGLDLPAQPLEKSAAASPYRVLARLSASFAAAVPAAQVGAGTTRDEIVVAASFRT